MSTPPPSRRAEQKQHLNQLLTTGGITQQRYDEQMACMSSAGRDRRKRSDLRADAINAHHLKAPHSHSAPDSREPWRLRFRAARTAA